MEKEKLIEEVHSLLALPEEEWNKHLLNHLGYSGYKEIKRNIKRTKNGKSRKVYRGFLVK
jgi:hypothetical protein